MTATEISKRLDRIENKLDNLMTKHYTLSSRVYGVAIAVSVIVSIAAKIAL